MGFLPEALLNFLAFLGWAPGEGEEQEIFTPQELAERFSLEHVNKAGAVFSYDKLDWMNGEYIRAMPQDELARARACRTWRPGWECLRTSCAPAAR